MSYKWTNTNGEKYQLNADVNFGGTPGGQFGFTVQKMTIPGFADGINLNITYHGNRLNNQPVAEMTFSEGKFVGGSIQYSCFSHCGGLWPGRRTEDIEKIKGEMALSFPVFGYTLNQIIQLFEDSDLPENYKRDLRELIK